MSERNNPVRRRCPFCNGTGEMDRRCNHVVPGKWYSLGKQFRCGNLAMMGSDYCKKHQKKGSVVGSLRYSDEVKPAA